MGFSRKTKRTRGRTIKRRGGGMWKTSSPKKSRTSKSKSKSKKSSIKGIDMAYHQIMIMPAIARAKGASKTRTMK